MLEKHFGVCGKIGNIFIPLGSAGKHAYVR